MQRPDPNPKLRYNNRSLLRMPWRACQYSLCSANQASASTAEKTIHNFKIHYALRIAHYELNFWRRVRDLNPRCAINATHDFQSCSLSRSDNSPQRRKVYHSNYLLSRSFSILGGRDENFVYRHFVNRQVAVRLAQNAFGTPDYQFVVISRPVQYRPIKFIHHVLVGKIFQ